MKFPAATRSMVVTAMTIACQLLGAPPTLARVDPLNVIARQIHKPNMLILLDTSGSLTGVPGASFDYSEEVGVDCDAGLNCRGGLSQGTCVASGKPCATDEQCRTSTCKTGLAECVSSADCQPIPGRCSTGQSCYDVSDCPAMPNGRCAATAATCSASKRCTAELRCKHGSTVCASDSDCDPGVCANNTTTCTTAADCPYATSGGTCAWGTTPAGGCSPSSSCQLRPKVCSNDATKQCASTNDCGGTCKKAKTACASNNDCRSKSGDSCDFSGRTCSSPANNCMYPRQTCTIRYSDNRCEDRNTCIRDASSCSGVTTNTCMGGVADDSCNAPTTTTGSRMCRISQIKCDSDSDCPASGDACGPATSRTVIAKRVIRNIVSANANVVNMGLMTFYQARYYPYYILAGTPTTSTKSMEIKQGTLRANGCYDKKTGLTSLCTVNGQAYSLRAADNARYLIKGQGGGVDRYVDQQYCGWFCNIPGEGTGVFRGAYYEYADVQGTPSTLVTFPIYRGKVFSENGVTYRYYDARPDYYNGGPAPPIDTANCGNSCSVTCGARWDTQLSPFLSTDDSPASVDKIVAAFNQAMEPASYGGLITYNGTPSGCALENTGAPDKNHSAYHYMQSVKAADALSCRLNFVLFITDGEANGPGDSGCTNGACAASDPQAAGCTCKAVLAAYRMRMNLGVKTFVVGFSPDAASGAGRVINDNIARAGGTDAGDDGKAPFAFGAKSEGALTDALQNAIYQTVQGSYATSPSTASQGIQKGNTYSSGTYVMDSRVDFPSWRGHLIAYDVSGAAPVLVWDAAIKLETTDWRTRNVYTSDTSDRLIKIDVDRSSGAIRNRDVLHAMGLGGNVEEAELIARWMLGDPAMKNPAVLGAIINSTPIDVGPPIDGPLPGAHDFHLQHKDRPSLTYVGSDDGMVHAFFTRTVQAGGVTYDGGSEAFAYLAPNMMGAVTKLYAQGGQLADPRQHIYGGLANSPKVKNICVSGCTENSTAIWKTMLILPQGWGGNELFMLDITDPFGGSTPFQLYWSSVTHGQPEVYNRALGLTVSVPAFTFHFSDTLDDYRVLMASGYPVDEGSTTQGRTLLSTSVRSGAIMAEVPISTAGTACSQEYSLLSDVATSRRQAKNSAGAADGRKEFLSAYVGDTWGKLWRYTGGIELVNDFGCQHPLHFSPTVVQLDADDPNNPHAGDIYLVQVTNSSLDDDTIDFAPSHMVILKETLGVGGRPQLDTTFGTDGKIVLTAANTGELCAVTNATGDVCETPLPLNSRPLSTPMAIPKVDGTGFVILSNWYVPATAGCGKGTTYFLVHELGGGVAKLKQAFKIADEPVLSPLIVAGKLMTSSSKGPVVVDGSVTTNVVNTLTPASNVGDVFRSGGWTEIQ